MADEPTAINQDSIYESVVDALGQNVDSSADAFKTEVLMHVNAALGILVQAGCGRDTYVSDSTTLWDDFFGTSGSKGMAKNFVFTRTKMLFDPPSSAQSLKAMQANLDELIWRIEINEGGEDTEEGVPVVKLR